MTDLDVQLLMFERDNPGSSLAKDLEIWGRFGLSATTYYRRLGDLIDEFDAYAFDQRLVERLRRQRNVRVAFGLVDGLQ